MFCERELQVRDHPVQEVLDTEEISCLGDVVQTVGPVVPVTKSREGTDSNENRFAKRDNDAAEDGQLGSTVDLSCLKQERQESRSRSKCGPAERS